MNPKFKNYFMKVAMETATLSHAIKAKVGAVIVKDGRIISLGYNGMPAGWDNKCEHWKPKEGVMFDVAGEDMDIYGDWYTNKEVLHAEANAITKLAKSNESGEGATLVTTHMPCIECAKLIHQSGIIRVAYNKDYKATKGYGKPFLEHCGIELEQISPDSTTG